MLFITKKKFLSIGETNGTVPGAENAKSLRKYIRIFDNEIRTQLNQNDTLTYFITNTSDIGLLEYVTGIINDINNLSNLKDKNPNIIIIINELALYYDKNMEDELIDTIEKIKIKPEEDMKSEYIKNTDNKINQYIFAILNKNNNNKKPITLKEFQKELDENMVQFNKQYTNHYKLNNFIETIKKMQTYYNIVKNNSITLIDAKYILPKYILENNIDKQFTERRYTDYDNFKYNIKPFLKYELFFYLQKIVNVYDSMKYESIIKDNNTDAMDVEINNSEEKKDSDENMKNNTYAMDVEAKKDLKEEDENMKNKYHDLEPVEIGSFEERNMDVEDLEEEDENMKNKYHDLEPVDINSFGEKNKDSQENYYFKNGHNIKTYLNVFFTKDCNKITPIDRIKNLIKIFTESIEEIDFYDDKSKQTNEVRSSKRITKTNINDIQKKEINETFKETQNEIEIMMKNFVDMCTEIKTSEETKPEGKNDTLITNILIIEKLYEYIKNFFNGISNIENIEQLYENIDLIIEHLHEYIEKFFNGISNIENIKQLHEYIEKFFNGISNIENIKPLNEYIEELNKYIEQLYEKEIDSFIENNTMNG